MKGKKYVLKSANLDEYYTGGNHKEDVKSCPYCGCEVYYVKEKYNGTCNHYQRFDGKDMITYENEGLYSNASHKLTSIYAYCSDCNKKVFKIPESGRY